MVIGTVRFVWLGCMAVVAAFSIFMAEVPLMHGMIVSHEPIIVCSRFGQNRCGRGV